MNFISRIKGNETQVELKYCERCGGLFLRRPATDVVYCAGCMARLTARHDCPDALAPAALRKPRAPRLVKGPKPQEQELQGAAQIEYLQGVAAREVRA